MYSGPLSAEVYNRVPSPDAKDDAMYSLSFIFDIDRNIRLGYMPDCRKIERDYYLEGPNFLVEVPKWQMTRLLTALKNLEIVP